MIATVFKFIGVCCSGIAICLHILVGILKAVFFLPFWDHTEKSRQVRIWSIELLRLMGVEPVIRGCVKEAMSQPVMFIANHVSWLDICLLNSATPARFVAKSEVSRWPLIGVLARATGSMFLRRECARDVLRVKEAISAALRRGEHVALFPEGTTTDGTSVLRFHSGLVEGAVAAACDVCPVAIRYQHDDDPSATPVAFVGQMTFLESIIRILMCRGLVAEVVYLPFIGTKGKDRRQIAAASHDAITRTLRRNSGLSSVPTKPVFGQDVSESRVWSTA